MSETRLIQVSVMVDGYTGQIRGSCDPPAVLHTFNYANLIAVSIFKYQWELTPASSPISGEEPGPVRVNLRPGESVCRVQQVLADPPGVTDKVAAVEIFITFKS